MSFRDCIIAAQEAGKIGKDKGAEALEAYDATYDSMVQGGQSPDVAAYAAAHEALKTTTELKYAQRKARISQMRKEYDIAERMKVSDRPGMLAQNLATESFLHWRAAMGQLAQALDTFTQEFFPKNFGLTRKVDNMDDVVRAVKGEAVGPEATAMGKAVVEFNKLARNLLNNEGANIRELDDYLPQPLARPAVRDLGEQGFVDMYMGRTDAGEILAWDEMRYAGKKIEEDSKEAVLRKIYDRIITGTSDEARQGALVNRLNEDRFFHYANADAWLAVNKQLGTGDLYHILVNELDTVARSYSLMKVFGPNPDASKAFVKQAVARRREDLQRAAKASGRNSAAQNSEKIKAQASSDLVTFDEMYAIHAREVDAASGDALAVTAASVRSWVGTVALARSIVSNLADPVYGMIGRNLMNIPGGSVIPRYIDAMLNSKNARQEGIDAGILMETMYNAGHEAARYNVAQEGSHFVRKVSEISYRLQGAQAWQEAGRRVSGLELGQLLARVQHMPFDEIPFVAELRTLGITERDWKLVRDTQFYEPQYYQFGKGKVLRPIDMYRNAGSDEAREAAQKFLMFQEHFVQNGTPHAGLRARQFLGGARPNSQFMTQVMKTSTQLMLFGASVHFQYWARIFQANISLGNRFKLAGIMMAYSTLAGAGITQIKDMLNGKKPHPMDTKEFWMRAMLNGGAGGLVGDMIYDYSGLSGSQYGAQTPVGQQGDRIAKLGKDMYREIGLGEDRPLGADVAQLAFGLFPQPPGVKLMVDRMIIDPILELSDPAAYSRKLQAQQELLEEQGQGTWWGVGESPFS